MTPLAALTAAAVVVFIVVVGIRGSAKGRSPERSLIFSALAIPAVGMLLLPLVDPKADALSPVLDSAKWVVSALLAHWV